MNQTVRWIIIYLLLILLIFFLCLAFFLFPYYYDWFAGKNIVNQHIQEVVGNETDPKVVSVLLLQWVHENVHYPNLEEQSFSLNSDGSGIYKINNKTRLFLRGGHASWIIKTKLGRCGEDARYFIEIMGSLGFEAKIIRSPQIDHALAEYSTKEGYKIIVDPSSNSVGINLQEWTKERNVTKLFSEDVKGKKEDISERIDNFLTFR